MDRKLGTETEILPLQVWELKAIYCAFADIVFCIIKYFFA